MVSTGLDEAIVWTWLAEVADPEIPVISVVDLGIVRAVGVDGDSVTVTLTPTYSGCPATHVIEAAVREALQAHGVDDVRIVTRLSPAWTTDWLSEEGKRKLHGYGIAPPARQVIDISGLRGGLAAAVSRSARAAPAVACPHCGSTHTELTSQFGSTPCKALYRCRACREPFDYFKCH
ncbi:1,2-phenylacetyl-CoA epoxidase subunit PaaD [Pseudoduganella albidiflava]|uniref:Phenylacetate-CoA oxygenase subunit PaaJ n=1 Tax=Pseudoduganella albidiflava TaxID=321983 RepID=A0A411WSF2_9BURK|nr:1,2-phenylacetyl-CoA epoxidase subunit PaaD [Pseudoduganella albidiflava]QBH99715.1 phenylacetate-CoA oxygenase subunit PaaJ [Pseudoduganella albidiflava]GGY62524.1 phenylacetate-CoA oxygenase subunit PaaJ [Pseudoduganella albidiflava]